MASTATSYLAEKSSADVIIQIAKPVLRQKKLFLVTKRVFDIVCSFLGLLILAIPMMIIALIITITCGWMLAEFQESFHFAYCWFTP